MTNTIRHIVSIAMAVAVTKNVKTAKRNIIERSKKGKKMTKKETVEYFRMRLNNITHPPTTRQQKAFETSIAAIEELWQYKALGYTPEELQLVFNPPEEIYTFDEEGQVIELDVHSENCIALAGKYTHWNCINENDCYCEIPLAGLNKEYFLSREAAEAAIGGKSA